MRRQVGGVGDCCVTPCDYQFFGNVGIQMPGSADSGAVCVGGRGARQTNGGSYSWIGPDEVRFDVESEFVGYPVRFPQGIEKFSGPGFYPRKVLPYVQLHDDAALDDENIFVHSTGVSSGEIKAFSSGAAGPYIWVAWDAMSWSTVYHPAKTKLLSVDQVARRVYFVAQQSGGLNYYTAHGDFRNVCYGIHSCDFSGRAVEFNVVDGRELSEDMLSHGGGDVHTHHWNANGEWRIRGLNGFATGTMDHVHLGAFFGSFFPESAVIDGENWGDLDRPRHTDPIGVYHVPARPAYVNVHACGRLRMLFGFRIGGAGDVVFQEGHVRFYEPDDPGEPWVASAVTGDPPMAAYEFKKFNAWSCDLDSGAVELLTFPHLPTVSDVPGTNLPFKNGMQSAWQALHDTRPWGYGIGAYHGAAYMFTVDESNAAVYYWGNKNETWPWTGGAIIRTDLTGASPLVINPPAALVGEKSLVGICVVGDRVWCSFGDISIATHIGRHDVWGAEILLSCGLTGGGWRIELQVNEPVETRHVAATNGVARLAPGLVNIQYYPASDFIIGMATKSFSAGPIYGIRPDDPKTLIYFHNPGDSFYGRGGGPLWDEAHLNRDYEFAGGVGLV